MKLRKTKAMIEWEEKQTKELAFWILSQRGEELSLCMISQGYENRLGGRLMCLLGSGFGAMDVIKDLKKYL